MHLRGRPGVRLVFGARVGCVDREHGLLTVTSLRFTAIALDGAILGPRLAGLLGHRSKARRGNQFGIAAGRWAWNPNPAATTATSATSSPLPARTARLSSAAKSDQADPGSGDGVLSQRYRGRSLHGAIDCHAVPYATKAPALPPGLPKGATVALRELAPAGTGSMSESVFCSRPCVREQPRLVHQLDTSNNIPYPKHGSSSTLPRGMRKAGLNAGVDRGLLAASALPSCRLPHPSQNPRQPYGGLRQVSARWRTCLAAAPACPPVNATALRIPPCAANVGTSDELACIAPRPPATKRTINRTSTCAPTGFREAGRGA